MIPQKLLLYAGPTLSPAVQLHLTTDVLVLPPVRRGDLNAVDAHPASTVVAIADGLFGSHPAVGHREIRERIEAGRVVWGLSSIGAIRACEMRALGMRGYGEVYRAFCEEEGFDDDEVALLHGADPPFRSFSEPLIHLRIALQAMEAAGLITEEGSRTVVNALKSSWFGERTLSRFRALAGEWSTTAQKHAIDAFLYDFDRFRVKSRDLADFLRAGAWRTP